MEEGTLRYPAIPVRRDASYMSAEIEDHTIDEVANDALTDDTMLDSVVLPAIVSVRMFIYLRRAL
jgi:hypothetical protein